MLIKDEKVILVDWGYFMFTAIYQNYRDDNLPSTFLALTMLFSALKKVGIERDDLVIIACDSEQGSWRKQLDSNYKSNRAEIRAKQDIDFEKEFKKFDEMLANLNLATPFHIIKIDLLEADDIIAVATQVFKDKKCIIISADSDFEQLFVYDNVHIYSPKSKKYKLRPSNPYSVLLKKIKKERADNLVSPILNERDFEIRKQIVNLIELPQDIYEHVKSVLLHLPSKSFNPDIISYPYVRQLFAKIYNKNGAITYRQSFKRNKKIKNRVDKLAI